MTATDSQAFFDALRQIDQRVDELRRCMGRALIEGNLPVMDRRYIIGEHDKTMVFKLSVEPVVPTGPVLNVDGLRLPKDEVTEALADLVSAVTIEVNEKGAGGYLLARLSDARDALKRAAEKFARRRK